MINRIQHINITLFAILQLFLFNPLEVWSQSLVLNEVLTNNKTGVQDSDGDYNDWIEVFNPTSQTINLLNYYLSDKQNNLYKWSFPNVDILPNEYLLVFASGKGISLNNEIHTNFSLSEDGEFLFLSNDSGQIISQMSIPPLGDDIPYGLLPNGGSNLFKLHNSSPGSSNNNNDIITLHQESGFFKYPIYQKGSTLMGDTIFYTTDGEEPSPISSNILHNGDSILLGYRYNDPNYFSNISTTPQTNAFTPPKWTPPSGIVDKAHILRYATFRNGIRTSEYYAQTIFVDSTYEEKYKLPIISIIAPYDSFFGDQRGIYVPGNQYFNTKPYYSGNYNRSGRNWERRSHLEYFDENKSLGFRQDVGLRIHGMNSRLSPQKSLRVYARNDYGNKFINYKLLPRRNVDKYKRFIIRCPLSEAHNKTMIRDKLAQEIVRDLNFEKQDYHNVEVFINGEYWGLHAIRDRIDEYSIEYMTGENKDSLNIITANEGLNYEATVGSNTDYLNLLLFANSFDLSLDHNYDYINKMMDMDSYIDYMIAEMYLKNVDWPKNNNKAWKSNRTGSKWRWICYDMDACFKTKFSHYDYNMIEHCTSNDSTIIRPNSPESTLLFRSLLENEEFKNDFLNKYAYLLKSTFDTAIIMPIMDDMINEIDYSANKQIDRWGVIESYSQWQNNLDSTIRLFLYPRSCVVKQHIIDYFDADTNKFNCTKIYGCIDSTMFNYNPYANTDDGSCIPFIYGCIDPEMLNYDSLANTSDNSCIPFDNYSLYVYPNPANATATVRFNNSEKGFILLNMYNTIGRRVKTIRTEVKDQINLDVSKLDKGIYFIEVISRYKKWKSSILVQ